MNHLLHILKREFWVCRDGGYPIEDQGDPYFCADWAASGRRLVGECEFEEGWERAVAVVQGALEVVHASSEKGTVVLF